MEVQAQVCVVGGGPAGAATSLQVARLGYSVVLLEADTFHRPHVGESLAPGIVPLLDRIGVRQVVEQAGFLRSPPPLVFWAGRIATSRGTTAPEAGGLLVDRGVFDLLLLNAARRAGVRVIRPAKALRAEHLGPLDWKITAKRPDGNLMVRAAFLVDACGRRSLLPGQRRHLAVPTVAMYAYWRQVPSTVAEPRIEAGLRQWYWAAPLAEGVWNAIVFVAPSDLTGCATEGSTYCRLLAESELLRDILCGRCTTSVRVCSASPVAAEEPVGGDWLKVGDAAIAMDPLAAQGVQAAIAHALSGACVVHTLLTHAGPPEVPINYYRSKLHAAATHHAQVSGGLYEDQYRHCPSAFWKDRAQNAVTHRKQSWESRPLPRDDRPLVLSASAVLSEQPAIEGDKVFMRRTLCHESLDGPIAFLGGVPVGLLFDAARKPERISEFLLRLAKHLPPSEACKMVLWLWQRQILTAAPA